jgi:hypothetical protein
MKRIVMINTVELPVIGTLYFQAMKFMSSFKAHGYEMLEVNDMDSLLELNLSREDVVYVSDHGLSINFEKVYSSFEKFKNLECLFILWFYHSHIDKLPMPQKWILTGEHFRKKPKVKEHIDRWDIQNKLQNYVPMTFATAILPENIGKFQRNESLRASFVGAPYQIDWCRELVQTEPGVLVRYTPPFITEEQRIMIYLSSVVSLGFHSPNNASNSVIVERVFEGLALGNIVVSDNPVCEEFTDGNVKYVSTIQDVKEEIARACNNPEERASRQKSGMLWCKEKGTYVNVSKAFLEKSWELWG